MANISAIPMPHGDRDFVGPTYAQFKLSGYMGNPDAGIMLSPISPIMATPDEVDHEVDKLIKEVEKAGRAAKKILEKGKNEGSSLNPG